MSRVLAALALLLALAPAARAEVVHRQLELPTTSLFDAQAMGPGTVRFALAAGFPYVQGVAGVGLADAVDLNLQVDTLYGAATQLSLGPKVRLAGDEGLAFAVGLQAQWTGFRNAASTETSGSARHLTGLRNWGLQPSAYLSSRGRAGSVFGVVQLQETYATEDEIDGPLSGPAPRLGTNLGLYVGGELNSGTALVHLYGLLGVDLHFRSGDSPALPRIELGFTFPG
jgi:hypothetical protein